MVHQNESRQPLDFIYIEGSGISEYVISSGSKRFHVNTNFGV